jgi:glucokinase
MPASTARDDIFLGIEIGGTKLQFGVGAGDGSEFADFRRLNVSAQRGAEGILEQLAGVGRELIGRHGVKCAGIGFGGPVDSAQGRTIKSHQVAGWNDFPLVDWCRQILGVRTVLGNDCDVATLAEARYGAGRGRRVVFFVTVGTGVGGGCAIDGQVLGRGRPAIAEIGHLRPGLDAVDPHATVEARASGWGIAAAVREALSSRPGVGRHEVSDLLSRCQGDVAHLTTVTIADAARDGNQLALQAIDDACRTLGWAVAQVVTLLAPDIVVVGGGVSLLGEQLFFRPLRRYVRQYVFPPLERSYELVPAGLGEQVVVHGAMALAAGL